LGKKIKEKKGGRTKIITKKKSNSNAIVAVIFILGALLGYYWLSSEGTKSEKTEKVSPAIIAKGRGLYNANCAKCHGIKGIGVRDESGNLLAPPLDESAHAWHHTDEALIEIILNGSPRNPKMIPWRAMFARDDVVAIVEYIKSLWSERIRACQGPKHVRCM